MAYYYSFSLFFFNDTATTEIYTLSIHDALPIFQIEDSVQTGVYLLSGYLSLLYCPNYSRVCVGLLLWLAGDDQHVSSGTNGFYSSPRYGSSLLGSFHGQIVRDYHSGKTDVLTQQLYSLRREARRALRFYGRVE